MKHQKLGASNWISCNNWIAWNDWISWNDWNTWMDWNNTICCLARNDWIVVLHKQLKSTGIRGWKDTQKYLIILFTINFIEHNDCMYIHNSLSQNNTFFCIKTSKHWKNKNLFLVYTVCSELYRIYKNSN